MTVLDKLNYINTVMTERWQKKWVYETRTFQDDWIGENESYDSIEDFPRRPYKLCCTKFALKAKLNSFLAAFASTQISHHTQKHTTVIFAD